jgi:hypothetical protein
MKVSYLNIPSFLLPQYSSRNFCTTVFTEARLANNSSVSEVRLSPALLLIDPEPLQFAHVGRQSFASWPRGSLPFCWIHMLHQIGHSLLQCPLPRQWPQMLDEGSGGGERFMKDEMLRRTLPAKLVFRFADLAGTGGVRGSVCAIILLNAMSMVSAD